MKNLSPLFKCYNIPHHTIMPTEVPVELFTRVVKILKCNAGFCSSGAMITLGAVH